MIKQGDKLPPFELQNQDGKTVSDKNFAGKKLVIFFYPQASTPTCTVEACNLTDNYEKLQAAGYQIIGVSADSIAKQKKFHEKFKMRFDLLADENGELLHKFGVWKEKTTFGKTYMGIVRTTFIFDENGICIRVIDKVKSKDAAAQILQKA